MKIITVSRQFGSGGRELGKRLADLLEWDYYDREIIEALAEEQGLDPDYVHKVLSGHGWHQYQLTYRNSFHHLTAGTWKHTEVLVRQREILKRIAEEGNDCVIVGRDADVILQDHEPFRIYVCAEMQSRIDRNRRQIREILTGKTAGDGSSFDMTVNATGWDIRELTGAVADFSKRWFERGK